MHQRHRTSRVPAVIAVAMVVGLAAGACSGEPTSTAQETGGTTTSSTIVIANRTLTPSLDPAAAGDNPSMVFARAVYDTLVSYDPEKQEYQPGLATEWEASDTSDEYTFKLRKNVTFHDDSALTASGVVTSLERTRKVGKGRSHLLDGVTEMKAPDDQTLVLHLNAPDAAFASKLSQIFIMSAKAIADHESEDEQWWGSNAAGSGPYKLAGWTPNNSIDLTKFDAYWRGWDGKHVDGYKIKMTEDTTQSLELNQGTVDIVDSLNLQEIKKKQADEANFTVHLNSGIPFYVALNHDSKKLQDVRVREAIAKAIPYREILNDVMLGLAQPLAGPVPGWMAESNKSLTPTETDIAGAKAALAAAGYTQDNPLKLTLMYQNSLAVFKTMATAIQASAKEIGIEVELQGAPWPTFSSTVADPSTRPDMGLVAMSVPTSDPGPVLTGSFDPDMEGAWTYWGYNEPQTVELLRSAVVEPNPKKQSELFQQVQADLVDQYAMVWLMNYSSDVLVSKSTVKGLVMAPTDRGIDYWAAYKD